MNSPKMQGPSQAELDATNTQAANLAKQNKLLDDEEAKRKAKLEADTAAVAGNRVGMRSLLSNDWEGFARGGDLSPPKAGA